MYHYGKLYFSANSMLFWLYSNLSDEVLSGEHMHNASSQVYCLRAHASMWMMLYAELCVIPRQEYVIVEQTRLLASLCACVCANALTKRKNSELLFVIYFLLKRREKNLKKIFKFKERKWERNIFLQTKNNCYSSTFHCWCKRTMNSSSLLLFFQHLLLWCIPCNIRCDSELYWNSTC